MATSSSPRVQLPIEIVRDIFECLGANDLESCVRVSKSWKEHISAESHMLPIQRFGSVEITFCPGLGSLLKGKIHQDDVLDIRVIADGQPWWIRGTERNLWQVVLSNVYRSKIRSLLIQFEDGRPVITARTVEVIASLLAEMVEPCCDIKNFCIPVKADVSERASKLDGRQRVDFKFTTSNIYEAIDPAGFGKYRMGNAWNWIVEDRENGITLEVVEADRSNEIHVFSSF